MTGDEQKSPDPAELAAALSAAVRRTHRTVSAAESLTSGAVASVLGAAEGSGDWFCGAVVAYTSEVKYKVLGVDPGPVVTAACALQMARGVRGLTGSDLAVATTGAGGPDPVEGKPAGTVFLAISSEDEERVEEHRFDGDPGDVVQATTVQALTMLLAAAERQAAATED